MSAIGLFMPRSLIFFKSKFGYVFIDKTDVSEIHFNLIKPMAREYQELNYFLNGQSRQIRLT
jgi:hypothetical protein